jgi:NTE family protein
MEQGRFGSVDDLKIGLALAAGGARGSAHTGVMKVLDREGVSVSAIAGSSIGAIVGAAHAAGIPVSEVEREWREDMLAKVARSFLPTLSLAGLSSGKEKRKVLQGLLGDHCIEDLKIPFAAVACDIDTGEAVVIDRGPLIDAVQASASIPGIFEPVRVGGRLLVDGGLVEPLPVRACRELGADFVIAVDIVPTLRPTSEASRNVWGRVGTQLREDLSRQTWLPASLAELLEHLFQKRPRRKRPLPGLYSILNQSVVILEREILRLKLIKDPPDLLIRPDLVLTPMSYLRASEGIRAGEDAAKAALPELKRCLTERSEASRRDAGRS